MGESGDNRSPMQNKREREEAAETISENEETISKKQRNEVSETSSEAVNSSSSSTPSTKDSKASEPKSSPTIFRKEQHDTKGTEKNECQENSQSEAKSSNETQKPEESSKEKVAETESKEAVSTTNSGPKLGFGAFASRSAPFKSATALTQKAEDAAVQVDKDWAASSTEKVSENQEIVVRKKEVQKPDLELTTGEEDETTVHSSRVKLYSMAKDQSWKERGTGLLKLNYQENNKAARLVMRSEGVLKLILNVKLFGGMQCDLEQERFLRLVAMEPEGLTHLAIKFANATEASSFLKQLKSHIPRHEADTINEN